ncbi:hypothetical protein HIM_12696 [Hirsutella minnesotensis 3608]|uniref:Reverse transcriptase Ty1/copia-type domain-containing protein n=1 Tax=Hirsutella minnesotensis 3608 TaxID=1043627 RepID=A0A0F7ZHR8_9HYPO|nr:hypothetical protein HIM_12696 [Hirsutella minnesotensis 3608]
MAGTRAAPRSRDATSLKIRDQAHYERLIMKKQLHRRDLPEVPRFHRDLLKHPLKEQFLEAERLHLQSHKDMNSWNEVNVNALTGRPQILDCMWVYTYKYDKHGRLDKCKARLVVRGDQESRNGQDTYAATLAGRSFRTLMAMAARFDLELIQFDAVNAFVNAKLEDDVFMRMPPGHRKHGTVLKLNKALYGLRKSPLLWHRELTSTLIKMGFKPVPHEPCCLTLDGIVVFFYVDDIVFAYRKNHDVRAQALEAQLRSKYRLTGGNALQWFIGIEILRDREKGLIWLSQASYIDKITRLIKHRGRDHSPMASEELTPFEGIASHADINRYQVRTGSILYAAVITRPDVAFVASKLAKFNSNPGLAHERAADRALSYLARTRGLALRLGGGDDFEVASDASFADDSTDRKSSQAFAMKLFDGLIGWRAGKQDTVTTSTTEAELLALSQAAKESLYVSRLIKELDVVLDRGCISIQCDNRQTIRLVTAEVATLQTKLRHIDVHNHWLRQEVANNTLGVTYTPTAEIMADGLTKALQGSMFRTFVERMGLEDITDRLAARELPETTDSMLQEQIYEAWEEQEV